MAGLDVKFDSIKRFMREGDISQLDRDKLDQSMQGFLGVFIDETQFRTAHPTGNLGEYAFLKSTGTYWGWDTTANDWTDTGSAIASYTKAEVDNLLNAKQNINEGTLTTTAKTIPGAINEINGNRYTKEETEERIEALASTYRGAFDSKAALLAYTGPKNNNDRAVVKDDETHSHECWEYIYDGTAWQDKHRINESPMTDAQLAALNSGITAAKVTSIDGKLDKSTTTVSIEHAYTHTASGDSIMQINSQVYPNVIVRRDLDSQLNVPLTPAGNEDATSKKYVDDSLALKLDKQQDVSHAGDYLKIQADGAIGFAGGSTVTVNWGSINGNISNQSDLIAKLNEKLAIQQSATLNGKVVKVGSDGKLTFGEVITGVSWGDITGDISSQADLMNKFALYRTAADQDSIDTTFVVKVTGKGLSTNDFVSSLYYDKTTVDMKISSITATYRGKFATKAALLAYSGEKHNNDYAYVTHDESQDGKSWRYTYNGTEWLPEYCTDGTAEWGHVAGDITTQADLFIQFYTKVEVEELVATNSAKFRGAFATKAALIAYSGEKKNNDYAVVLDDETLSHECWRYKYTGSTWLPEYRVNETALTTEQWNALNSTITALKVAAYDAHIINTGNPHGVTKAQVGLGNVDNTSDLNKPISTATQAALDLKSKVTVSETGTSTTKGKYITVNDVEYQLSGDGVPLVTTFAGAETDKPAVYNGDGTEQFQKGHIYNYTEAQVYKVLWSTNLDPSTVITSYVKATPSSEARERLYTTSDCTVQTNYDTDGGMVFIADTTTTYGMVSGMQQVEGHKWAEVYPPTEITVDDAMSSTSTNPVQNKVVKAAIDGKSKVTVSDGGSATAKARYITIDNAEKKIADLDAVRRVTTMPTTPNADEQVVCYMGADTPTYKKGKFYQYVVNGAWKVSYTIGGPGQISYTHEPPQAETRVQLYSTESSTVPMNRWVTTRITADRLCVTLCGARVEASFSFERGYGR